MSTLMTTKDEDDDNSQDANKKMSPCKFNDAKYPYARKPKQAIDLSDEDQDNSADAKKKMWRKVQWLEQEV